jgi:hypothetical protein
MTKKTEIKDQIWTALFLVAPVIFLGKLGDIYTDNSLNRILLAGLFGGLGGLIGAGFLHLSKSKSTVIKTSLAALLIGLCVTTFVVVTKLNKPSLKTCEICGYKAIWTTKKQCEYCGNLPWIEKKKIKGYDDKQEWLKEEQLLWFTIDSLTEKIDFYKPTIDEGFVKDENWRPLVTEHDIKDEFNNENK